MYELNRRKFIANLSIAAVGTAFSVRMKGAGTAAFNTSSSQLEEYIHAETVYGKIKG